MTNPYDDDLSRFGVTFLRAVMAWNNAEHTARCLLIAIGGKNLGLRVVAEHLGSVALKDALNTICDALADEAFPSVTEATEHVSHFVTGFDTLRAYRNFYVHSLRFTGKAPDDPKTFRGFLHSVEAKGKLSYVEHNLSTDELERFMRHTLELRDYGDKVLDAMPGRRSGLSALAGLVLPEPLSSLQKPLWPEKLKKPRRYLGER